MLGAGLVMLTGLLLSAFRAGGNRVKVKILKKEIKANDEHTKNRKHVADLSDDGVCDELRK